MNKKEKNKQSILPSQLGVPAVWPNHFPALNFVSKTDSTIYTSGTKLFKEHPKPNV